MKKSIEWCNITFMIQEKAAAGKPLTKKQKSSNRKKLRVCAKGGYVFRFLVDNVHAMYIHTVDNIRAGVKNIFFESDLQDDTVCADEKVCTQCKSKKGWIRKNRGEGNIIFIHGLNSDDEQCWRNKSGVYWPELIMGDSKLDKFGIYVYNYQTNFSNGDYSVSNIVDEFKEMFFTLDKINDTKSIVFVCHSLGGIIARKLVVENKEEIIKNKEKIGFFLIASPSLGSKYANWVKLIPKLIGHEQVEILRFSRKNNWLNDLDKNFLKLKEKNKNIICGKELYEDKFLTNEWKFLNFLIRHKVVEYYSANRYFADSIKIENSDHFTISQPENSKALQHRLLKAFIENNFIFSDVESGSQAIQSDNVIRTKGRDKIIRRYGTYYHALVKPYADNSHEYLYFERTDLLDYRVGDFHSIRMIHLKNCSEKYTAYLPYVECSEIKCSFLEANVRAFLFGEMKPLVVISYEDKDERIFCHAFNIYFPRPIAPEEEIKIIYSITLPGELGQLSNDNEIMSVFLGRVYKGVRSLKFSVCLNFEPKSVFAECEDLDEHKDFFEVPYDGEPIKDCSEFCEIFTKEYYNTLGIDWGDIVPFCNSIVVREPKHHLYKIRYMR